jgi:choline dehydrogenase-like flavoprotein
MINDPISEGLAKGWRHVTPRSVDTMTSAEFDVAIIGSGAGGGICAQTLTAAGFNVALIEEGPLKSSRDFDLEERHAYPNLYQESAARKTLDKGISILQGCCVGGSTTVNWTTSLRTPKQVLSHWSSDWGLDDLSMEQLTPHFDTAEQRLSIAPWQVPPNANNQALKLGCERLGWSYKVIPRNVKGCWNLGYCGMGCPTNAKQSMLVTTIPQALDGGATLFSEYRVQTLKHNHQHIESLSLMAADGTDRPLMIRARQIVLSAGSIGSPALLLRSKVPDPNQLIGKRTFLHPVLISGALMPSAVHADQGAPQSIYSDEFVWKDGISARAGYKLEVPPVHPILLATKLAGFGEFHRSMMQQFNQIQVTLALIRDGFHPQSQGGSVGIRDDGSPYLDYPITDYIWDGARRALLSMAELQFAAGAKQVMPIHEQGGLTKTWKAAKAMINNLPMRTLQTRLVSAHVMGGCPMGGREQTSVVNSVGQFRYLDNLTIIDGSTLPTSLGANPQLTIYALAMRSSEALIQRMRSKR